MSSVVDAPLNSDFLGAATPSSDPGAGRRRNQTPTSSRQRAPPSSAGAGSDIEGFPDDNIVGARGPNRKTNDPRSVPRVVDVTGETLLQRFEEFLEGSVWSIA
jgi:DNA replication licensing factor MCM6